MKKSIALMFCLSLMLTCLGLCGLHGRTAEGVSFVMRSAERSELLRGGDDENTEFIRLLKDEVLNINTASAKELAKLPAIGEALSQAIVDYREEHGAFERIEDVKKVEGIGEGRFEAFRERICVEKIEE